MIRDQDHIIDDQLGRAIRDSEHAEANPDQANQVASLFGWGGKLVPQVKTSDVIDAFNKNRGKVKGPSKEDIDAILGDDAPGHTMAGTEDELAPVDGPNPEPPTEVQPGPGDTGLTPVPADGPARLFDEMQRTEVPTEKRTAERNINIERHHQGAEANRDQLLADLPPDVAMEQMETADDVARLLEATGKVQDMTQAPRTHAELDAATDSPEAVKEILADVFKADKSVMGNLSDVQLLAGRKMLGTLGQEVAELTARITNGDQTPETLMQYQRKGEAFMALQAFMQGKVKEAARALSQQRMIAETLASSKISNITDFMQQGGLRTPEDIVRHAELTQKHIDAKGAEEGMVMGFKPQLRDYFKVGVEYWANNILSGIETHAVNMLGSPTVQLYEGLFVRPIAHGIGITRKGLGLGKPVPPGRHATIEQMENYNAQRMAWDERMRSQEHVARLAGATIGLRDGFTAFVDAIRTGQNQFGPEKGEEVRGAMHKVFGYHFGQKGEMAAALASGSFRMLGAEDGFWKTNVFRSEFTALAVRDAYAKDLDVNEHVMNVLTNPHDFPELYEQAMHYSRKYTFTETDRPGILGDMSRATKAFLAKHPYLKFIMPFVDTPVNLLHYASENSVLAPFSKELREEMAAGGARADIAKARIVAGLGLTVTAYMLYDQGLITGVGPQNWKEKELQSKIGWQGEALYIAGEYYGVSRTDPFAMTIFGMVNELEAAKYAKEERGYIDGIIASALKTGNHAMEATFMKGMNDFMNVVAGNKDVKSWIANYATGLIPYSSLGKTASKMVDPQPRAINNDRNFENTWSYIIGQKTRQVIPGMSQDLRPSRWWDGTLKTPRGGTPVHKMTILDRIENAMSPIKVTQPMPPDPATEHLIENGLAPREPAPIVTVGGLEFSILTLDDGTGKLYDAYIYEVGKLRRRNINELIRTDEWKELDAGKGSRREQELGKALGAAKREGLAIFLTEILPRHLEMHPDKATMLAEMVGMDIEGLVELAHSDMLPEKINQKTNVRGIADKGQLPVPPHVEEQRQELPKF